MQERHYPSDAEARQLILEIGRRMYQKSYVAANDGNISCKVAPDMIWATPTGVSKGFMEEDNLVKMSLDGAVVWAGTGKPSSEIKMHLRVYNENPDAGGVVHAHSPVATAFSIAGIALDRPIYPEALAAIGVVPCVHYEKPGTQGVPDSIAPYCKSHNALLLGNHGPLAWGRTAMEAFYRLEAVEHYAMQVMYTSYIIGRANTLTCAQVEEVLEIRRGLGVESGGVPSRERCAETATNLIDVL
jgi:L-fuculose-phosphate aldolase